MGLPEVHRDVDGIRDTYCLFCGWPVILAENPNRRDFCDHVLFMALGDGGIVHIGDSARHALARAGFSVTACAEEWVVEKPEGGAVGNSMEDEDGEESWSVADLVSSISSALEPTEGLLLVDDPAFFGDTTLYLGLGRWSPAEPARLDS